MLTRIKESVVYQEFTSFNWTSQLIVIAQAVGGGMTAFAFVNGLLPFLYVSIPLAFVSSVIACKAAMKQENKKHTRIEQRQFYVESINNLQKMFDEAEMESQHLVLAAEAKLEKDNGNEEKTDGKKENNDFQSEEAIRRDGVKKGLSEAEIMQKVRKMHIDRRAAIRQKFAALGRVNAQRYEQGLSQLNDIIDELQAIEAGDAKAEDGANSKKSNAIANSEKAANTFSARFSLLVDTIASGMKAFVGAASTLYVILSYALSANYMSPAVVVPTIFVAFIASLFGLKVGYHDHKAEKEEVKEFDEFKLQMNNITQKHLKIIELNKKIRKIFQLEEQEKKDTLKSPTRSNNNINQVNIPVETIININDGEDRDDRKSWLKKTKTWIVTHLPGTSTSVAEAEPQEIELPPILRKSSITAAAAVTATSAKELAVVPPAATSTATTLKTLQSAAGSNNKAANDARPRALTTEVTSPKIEAKLSGRRDSDAMLFKKTKTPLARSNRLQPINNNETIGSNAKKKEKTPRGINHKA